MSGISTEEILRWRQQVWGDGEVSRSEADQLFELNDKVGDADPAWDDFFVDALTDYMVRGGQPRGYLTDPECDWLIERIEGAGGVRSASAMRLLDHLFERADFIPIKLKAFALDCVERAVSMSAGIAGDDGSNSARIDDAEVRLLRRFVFAPAGDGPAYVTRAEAEMLWRLKDRSLGQDNSREWMTFWVQALANHLLASPNVDIANRESALKHEAFLASPPSGLGSFLTRMVTARPDFAGAIGAAQAGTDIGIELGAVESGLDEEERQWTEGKVVEDGAIDDFEQALLEFVVR